VRSAVLILAATLAIPVAAEASSVTFDFTGRVFGATGIYSSIAIGASVTGTYTINIGNGNPSQSVLPVSLTSNWSSVNTNGTSVSIPSNSAYVFTTHADVGGIDYLTSSNPSATFSQSFVEGTPYVAAVGQNAATAGVYTGGESNDFTSTGGGNPQSEFQLLSSTGDPFDASGLPLFTGGITGLGFFSSNLGNGTTDPGSGVLQYQITSLTPVPLPTSAWLMLSGLGFLALRRRAA